MKINRRQFLKLSGLTGAGMWAGLPSFIQFFDFIPPVEQNFIPIIGIFPNPNSIKENGVHLRWVLPPSKGIPDSLTIFRKEHDEKENNILVRPADTDKKTLPEKINGITFSGPLNTFSLSETDHGECYEVKSINPNNILRITFSLGVDFCNIQLGVINPLAAKSYHEDGTLSRSVEINSPSAYRSILFQSANGRTIKYVEIPLNFKFLYFIEFNGKQFQCDNPDWEEIGFIDNENDLNNQLLFKRISPETKNFYLSNDLERGKYETTAKKYAGLMSAIRNPSEQNFLLDGFSSINDIPPDKLILKPKDGSQAKLNAWNLLMFGSLDPNNARMLGLYFVDSSVESEDEIYDYKVEADYLIQGKKIRICGVVQNVGGKYSYVPIINNPLTAIQTDKTWWEFDKDFNETHFGRVRLSWPIPEHNANNESWKRFVEPVVYALQADSQKSRLITPQPDESSLYFFDQRVIIKKEEINYTLTGVDIFGQTGNSLKQKIKLTDKDIPPAPVKLQFGYSGNQVILQYEYGGYQYLTDPRINKFTVYQKLESIYSSNKKIKYSSFEELGNTEKGLRIIKVNLLENLGSALFENIHFIESFDRSRLPAGKRKKFKISETSSNSVTFITSHFYTPEPKGIVLLESDIRNKNNGWINTGSVNFRNPALSSRLISYIHFIKNSDDPNHFSGDGMNDNSCLHAAVLSSNLKRRSENKNLFETNPMPPEQDEYTEIFIDRALIESDILTGGKISIGNISHDIASQSAGNAGTNEQSLQTKLIINTHLNVDSGTPVLISLPKINSDDNEKYIRNFMIFRIQPDNNLKSKSGGEILLRGIKNYKINEKIITETIPIAAQLFSDLYSVNNGSELEALVRIAKKISSLPASAQNLTVEISNKVLYFEPYIKNITNNIEQISLANDEAFKSVQFAVETIDAEGNKSPLSLFGQFIKTRSIEERPQTPERPFPCDNPAAAEGFLKIPDSEGRSAFCLQWNDIKDSSGNSLKYRYEVSRTLDKTIITVHKDLWLKGLVDSVLTADERIINNNNNLLISNSIASADSGLIDAAADYGFADNINPEIFKGGRLTQGTGNNRKYYEVVKCFRENSNLRLLLRQMVKTALADNFTDHSLLPSGNSTVTVNPISPISNSNFTLEAIPDYKQVLDDSNRLIELANLSKTNEFPNIPDGLGAFSLVTGQPLRNTNKFLDDAPGLGTGRFFYKVRSVDASENRSKWSPASVPVWQSDTTPPERVIEIAGHSINNKAFLFWKKSDTNISEYIFTRTQISNETKVTSRIQTASISDKPLQLFNAQILLLANPLVSVLPNDIVNKEQAAAFLSAQVSLFEITGTNPAGGTGRNLISNNQYKFGFTYDGSSNKIILKQIDFFVKRDAGIFYEIRFQDLLLNTEPGYLHFIDNTVLENEKYTYEVIAVKEIGPPANRLKITGASIQTKEIEIKNFSKPAGITITRSFISLSNSPLQSFAADSRTRITISKPAQKVFIKIIKQKADETKQFIFTDFTNESDNKIYKDWIELASEVTLFNFIDNEINSGNNFEYVIELKSELGVFSDPIILTI